MNIDIDLHWGNKELFNIGTLTSKIVYGMQTDGYINLHSREAFSGYDNGLFILLDEICDYWKWTKSQISITTSNRLHVHSDYNIIFNNYWSPTTLLDVHTPVFPWSGDKYYGMFIGRANAPRIYAAHLHNEFSYKQHGLTSFNDDLAQFMTYPELIDYFMHSGQTYKEMCSIAPYSDIGRVTPPPISGPNQHEINWSLVYRKLAIEIVCESSTTENCAASPSEKILRPLYFKRPFLLVGPPGMLEFIRSEGYKTFNEFIPEDYDRLSGIPRVTRIFEILHELIATKSIDTLLDQCNDILVHNHKLVMQHITSCQLINYETALGETNE